MVQVASKDDGLLSKSSGRHFSDERVADWTEIAVSKEGEQQEHGSDRPLCGSIALICNAEQTNNHEQTEQHCLTNDVELATTNMWHQEPGDENSDGATCILAKGERKGVADTANDRCDTSLSKAVSI